MKRLKMGTLVYHKDHGQGIVWDKDEHYSDVYDVLFVGFNYLITCMREDLFIKGDRVYYSVSFQGICKDNQKGIYRGFIPFKQEPRIYASNKIETDFFPVYDITHIENKPDIEITIKVNGKNVKLSSISEETLLEIRKNS